MAGRQVVVVTGAGTGIGAATARLAARRGFDVVLAGRRPGPLAEVAGELRAEGARAIEVPCDLADPGAPARLVAAAAGEFGRIDHLVNNAAVIRVEPLADYLPATLEAHWAVNLRAPFLLCQAALPWLTAARGSIVNVSSSSAAIHRPGQSLYGATKAALEYLTRSLAAELAPQGIRVNAIAPGPVDTPIHLTWAESRAAAEAWLAPQIPLGRIAAADEVADWIVRLISPEAGWMTGAVIPLDGGQTLDRA